MAPINRNIVATFVQIPHTITVTVVGNGSVTKNPEQPDYAPGTPVTITAIPDAGWRFNGWTVDGTPVSENPTIVVA